MATELLINIVSQATGKGFLESEKAVNKLEKKVKSLGKTLGVSLAAGAALKFSKTFIKAFAEDEKAAVRLNRAVENLGIGFANPSITKFIADLERTSAIADDVLRPAFQNLLSTTGSLTKSQELLNKAITISRGTGIDLGTVTDDLTKAYVGQTKGLSKYKTGLTAAELATKSFAEIVGIILTANLGAAEDYLDTTAYKMDVLSLATGNAQEIIGSGLVDALGSFAGSGEASDAQFVIEQLSTGFANLLKSAGAALGFLARLPEFAFTAVGLGAMYERPKPKPKTEDAFTIRQKQLLAKLEKASIDRAKKLAELAKKQANAEKLKTKENKLVLENGDDFEFVRNEKYLEDVEINMDLWLKFFGFWLAEGWTSSTPNLYQVGVAQTKNNGFLEEIYDTLFKMGFNPTYTKDLKQVRVFDKRLWNYLNQFGKAEKKYIPNDIAAIIQPH